MTTYTPSTYQELVHRLQDVVRRNLPAEATVIIISKGDPELLKLDGRRAWHFPQREDGVYAGYYPSDSATAIAHLEALRAKGGEFLIIPAPAFWWLQHYPEFTQHLENQYRVIVREEDICLIYALNQPPPEQQRKAVTGEPFVYQRAVSGVSARQEPRSVVANPPLSQPVVYPVVETERSLMRPQQTELRLVKYIGETLIGDLQTLFDAGHYAEQTGTVFSSSEEALIDYLERGYLENYSPHPLFDTAFYREEYPDVKVSGMNPLLHFLSRSIEENQNPNPYFDTEFYYSQKETLRENRINALVHYVNQIGNGAYRPNPLFSNHFYLDNYPEVKDGKWNPLTHYLRHGCDEGKFASATHANIVNGLLRASRRSLLRGNWTTGTVLLISYGDSPTQMPGFLQMAKIFAERYHLEPQVVLFHRQEWAADLEEHSRVIVLEDYKIACDILRPSALRLLLRSLCSMRPLFALCETQEILGALKSNGVPAYYYFPDFGGSYPQEVLKNLFHQAERVLFTSSTDFHAISEKLGFYPTNVALRPFDTLAPCLTERFRKRTRVALTGGLGLDEKTFIVLGRETDAPTEGFDLFLATAKMLRKRGPERDIAFVWLAKRQAGQSSAEHVLSLDGEVERSGLRDVVFSVDESGPAEPYLHAADALFLASLRASSDRFEAKAMSAALPVVCFEGHPSASETAAGNRFVIPYLDVEASCDTICQLYDERTTGVTRTTRPNCAEHRGQGMVIGDYAESLMKLAKRDFDLPAQVYPLNESRTRKTTRKIVIPCCDWGVSGVNSSLEAVGKELIRLGWEVQIIFTRDPAMILETAGSDAHLPQIPYDYLQPKKPGVEGMWEALISHLEVNAPCILFMTYDFTANGVAPALTDKVGVVEWVQADDGDYYEQTYRLGRYCNAIVCVSQRIKERIAELNPLIAERACVIHNSSVQGSEIVGKRTRRSETMRLVYTGRLVQYQKRVLDFIELAQCLDATAVPYELTLIGNFIARENIQDLFETRATAHLEDGRIRLPGRMVREQILEELSRQDIFLLLSDFEGLPLALIEAMARGCVPVVAEMHSGIPEVITSGENGLIMRGRDYQEWAAVLADLWRNPKRLSQMSQKARKTVRERLTVEQTGRQFDALFRRVAEDIGSGEYQRPPSLHWGVKRSRTGDVLPPPSIYRSPITTF